MFTSLFGRKKSRGTIEHSEQPSSAFYSSEDYVIVGNDGSASGTDSLYPTISGGVAQPSNIPVLPYGLDNVTEELVTSQCQTNEKLDMLSGVTFRLSSNILINSGDFSWELMKKNVENVVTQSVITLYDYDFRLEKSIIVA